MKRIAVVDIRGESVRDARIEPGTTPDDLRRALGLPDDYQFSPQPGAEPFGSDANLYLAVPDGAKLYAGTEVNVGTDGQAGFFSMPYLPTRPVVPSPKIDMDLVMKHLREDRERKLFNFLEPSSPAVSTTRPVVVVEPPRPLRRVGIAPVHVQRQARPLWQERGWRRIGDAYHGEFKTPHGRWQGKAVQRLFQYKLFIKNPPDKLESHPHGTCFFERDDGWHFVHFTDCLNDLSAGIVAVERILREVYES